MCAWLDKEELVSRRKDSTSVDRDGETGDARAPTVVENPTVAVAFVPETACTELSHQVVELERAPIVLVELWEVFLVHFGGDVFVRTLDASVVDGRSRVFVDTEMGQRDHQLRPFSAQGGNRGGQRGGGRGEAQMGAG